MFLQNTENFHLQIEPVKASVLLVFPMLVDFVFVVLIFTIPFIATSLVVETRLRFPPDVIVLFETLSIVIVPLLLTSNEPHVMSCSPNDDKLIPLAVDVIVIGSSVSTMHPLINFSGATCQIFTFLLSHK